MNKIGLVFPGQGAQSVGMGRELFDAFPEARGVLETADKVLGFGLSRAVLEGPEEELNRTDVAQPALLAVELAAWRALRSRWTIPAERLVAAGHSLGEFSAWVVSGVLELEAALKLVRLRGNLMQTAAAQVQGGMAAVLGASGEEVRELCRQADAEGSIQPANYNCPGQIVVSGSNDALDRFKALAAEKKVKVMPLKVSGPFHSRFMQSAGTALEEQVRGLSLSQPAFPVIANVTAEPVPSSAEVPGLMVSQVSGSVRWEESVRRMLDLGVEAMIEVGPGKVLRGLIKKIAPEVKTYGAFSAAEIETVVQELA